MSRSRKTQEPMGEHPYKVIFRVIDPPSAQGELPLERKGNCFYSANGKGCHDQVLKQFKLDHRHMQYQIISVRYCG